MPDTKRKPILPMTQERIDKFWSLIDRSDISGCWPWINAKTERGYGRFKIGYTEYRTHRIAFFLSRGKDTKLLVCHSCDNPPCCNPEHLFEGTSKDNTDDYVAKGRQHHNGHGPKGEKNGQAKLNNKIVAEIRAKYREGGRCQVSLAIKYGVSKSTIGYVVNHTYWK